MISPRGSGAPPGSVAAKRRAAFVSSAFMPSLRTPMEDEGWTEERAIDTWIVDTRGRLYEINDPRSIYQRALSPERTRPDPSEHDPGSGETFDRSLLYEAPFRNGYEQRVLHSQDEQSYHFTFAAESHNSR
ncbi:unnamed protein product [Penicillium crustosum]